MRTADGQALTTLTGQVITQAGWYDFTQVTDGGDGARYITNDDGRIVGVELNFTANLFGDKTPDDKFITDPGATVGTETLGTTLPPEVQQQIQDRTVVLPQTVVEQITQQNTPREPESLLPRSTKSGIGNGVDSALGFGLGLSLIHI